MFPGDDVAVKTLIHAALINWSRHLVFRPSRARYCEPIILFPPTLLVYAGVAAKSVTDAKVAVDSCVRKVSSIDHEREIQLSSVPQLDHLN